MLFRSARGIFGEEGESFVELSEPDSLCGGFESFDGAILLAGDFVLLGIDVDRSDQGRELQSFEDRGSHECLSWRPWVNGIPCGDSVVFGTFAAGRVENREIGVELIDEGPVVLFGDRFHTIGEFFEGLIVSGQRCGSLFVVIEGLGGNPSGPNVCPFGLIGHALQAVHVGFEGLFREFAVATVVHTEVDRHCGGFVKEDIAGEARVSARGAISPDADIAEGDFQIGRAHV